MDRLAAEKNLNHREVCMTSNFERLRTELSQGIPTEHEKPIGFVFAFVTYCKKKLKNLFTSEYFNSYRFQKARLPVFIVESVDN